MDKRGLIYFYDGSTWNLQYEADKAENLWQVFAIDQNHVWACGGTYPDYGVIYFFNGSSWIKQFETSGNINGIHAVDEDFVWAVGNEINSLGESMGVIYLYDGESWGVQHKTATTLSSVTAVDKENAWACGSYPLDYQFPSSLSWRSSGRIYYFNGKGWSEQHRVGVWFAGISSSEADRVWAVGFKSSWDAQDLISQVLFYDGTSWAIQEEMEGWLSGIWAYDNNHVWTAEKNAYFFDGEGWAEQYDA
ncbi:MAG: hypothetical protein SWK76_00600, partial [Actinomycetota bacterium]|nr:hypothetical protein [Actinomycetota bacterium]